MSATRQLAVAVAAQVLATATLAAVALAWDHSAAFVLAVGLCLSLCTSAGIAVLLVRRGRLNGELAGRLAQAQDERDATVQRAQRQRQQAEMEAAFREMDIEFLEKVFDGSLRLLRGEYVNPSTFAGLDDAVQGELQRACERVRFESAIRERINRSDAKA